MSDQVIFLTHGEVEIDPDIPVPNWGLSEQGTRRHAAFAKDALLEGVTSIFASEERKAVEAAQLVGQSLNLPVNRRAEFGENDRSATGYLPPDEFWPVVEQFFGQPEASIRGWERAVDAQTRIVGAVRSVCQSAPKGDVLIVAHGGVGALLRCHLLEIDITPDEGQPHSGGGCVFCFDRVMSNDLAAKPPKPTDWRAI
ncbi:MAG: histidine phosphatase family protein [Pseudomonadota bacterium]